MVRFGLSVPPPGSPNRLWETLRKFTGSFVLVDQEDGQSLTPMKIRGRAHGRWYRLNLGPTATFHRFARHQKRSSSVVRVSRRSRPLSPLPSLHVLVCRQASADTVEGLGARTTVV